ncbi:MAG: hypothetical protein AAF600_22220, partial [Bacteroidota bacterium]
MPINFTRKSGFRDARLIVITTEGEITENQYFEQLKWSEKYKNPRVHVEVLARGDSNSDPKNCLKILNSVPKKTGLKNQFALFQKIRLACWLLFFPVAFDLSCVSGWIRTNYS